MSVKCSDIINLMNIYAPPYLAESWDNIGLMIGDYNSDIKKILISLDINDDVITEAIKNNINMIITHHPVIFKPIKNINTLSPLGKRIINIIKNDICVFSAHTNLDIAKNGTNDTFAKLLHLNNIENLCEPVDGENGLGKVGNIENEIKFIDFVDIVKKIIKLDKVYISGNTNKIVKRIGIGTGKCSGHEYLEIAKSKECDVYITSDIGYHDAQYALDLGLCLIDATHYASEALIVDVLCDYLNSKAKELNMDFTCVSSSVNGQTLNIV